LKCDEKEAQGAKPFEPESPYVIVCEGFQDMAFVCALLKYHGISNCDVTYPKKTDGGNGQTGIKNVVSLLAGRAAELSGVFIVADADEDPAASFKEVAKAFVDPFKPPESGFTIHKTKKHRTGVFLIPGNGRSGALENLLLEAAITTNPNAMHCIEEFQRCCNTITDWPASKQAKMKFACYIASQCKNDPCCSPAYIWASKNKVLDIASPVFGELVALLKEFAAEEVKADPTTETSP
jgi:hypothetical protein